jgi:hypothetical protein
MAIAVADTPEQWLKLLADPTVDVVRSLDDWENFVALDGQKRASLYAGTPYEGVDPLGGVPAESIRSFGATLIFRNGGLGHANYRALVEAMPDTQFAALWASFGISDKLTTDYKDMSCASLGTCTPSLHDICTSNC